MLVYGLSDGKAFGLLKFVNAVHYSLYFFVEYEHEYFFIAYFFSDF